MSLLSAKDVSVMWKIPLARVYQLTRRGLIPAIRLGDRQLRYDPVALRELVNRGGGSDSSVTVEAGKQRGNSLRGSF